MPERMTAAALFAGIGGFCLGFSRAGIPTSWAVENDQSAIATYKANTNGVEVVTTDDQPADIRDVRVAAANLAPVDILHAGFPCQSFSQAGERKGFGDPRGQLFYEIIRIIREFGEQRPSVLILENSPHLRYGDGGSWFLELSKEIRRSGYWFRETNCAELDLFDLTELPQKRTRLFMVAFSTNHFRNGRFSFPTRESKTPKDLSRYVDFNGEADDMYYLSPENRYHKMITQKVDDQRTVYQLRKYLVRAKEPGVCPTLTANMGLGGHNVPFVHDKRGLRKLTEYECLRLQGFPEGFSFPDHVPIHRRYTQVGNSVSPIIAELLAKAVRQKIELERK